MKVTHAPESPSEPRARESIYAIRPYKGGASHAKPGQRRIKLSSNESALGPSPKALEALSEAARQAHRYPDGGATALRQALADRYGLPVEQLVCGAGSDEIIALLCQAYLEPGDQVVYGQHGFLMYRLSTLAVGGEPLVAPERDLRLDVEALVETLTPRTRLVFVTNPANPTGSYISRAELEWLHANLPESVVLCVDAAYQEYVVGRDDYTDGNFLIDRGASNVIVTRTFSKIHGLGGLRVGWAYGAPGIIDVLNRVRGPFNVASTSQAAALAALEDSAWEQGVRDLNSRLLPAFSQRVSGLGLHVYPSVTNFVLVELETPERRAALQARLEDQGILVRDVAAYDLPTCLRITLGTEEEMDACVTALESALADMAR